MSPDGSTELRGIDTDVEAAVETRGVLAFSLDELKKHMGERLGRGEFGAVYAIDGFPSLVVKEIAIEAHEGKLVELAERELEAIPRLSHPGILKYHQVIRDNHYIYIVMDRYHGDLKEFIADHTRNHKSIPKESILSIARQLGDALAYLHNPYKVDSCGTSLPAIVHRDLKPANILVSEDGNRIVLADFGLCKNALHDGITFAGSPSYMAPEAFIHRKTSRASDVWALGVIIYELATLKRPNFLEGREPKEVFINRWKPDLSPVKDDFIRSILEKIFVLDPDRRPTAKELTDIFQAPSTSYEGQGSHTTAWEAALKDANARIAALERELRINSSDISTLKSTIVTQTAEIDALKKELRMKSTKIDALEQQLTGTVKDPVRPNHLALIKDSSWTPLMRATVFGDIELVKSHLSDKDKKNSDGDTALILAARMEHEDIVEFLDPTDGNGITALMRAADRGDVEAARLLIPLQKEIRDKDGNTAFMHALKNKRTDIALFLRKHEAPSWTLLMCAAFTGDTELAKSHLSDKDIKNSDGDTALMIAARADHGDIVELIDPTDKDGVTALMRAADRNDIEAVTVLIPLQKGKKMIGDAYINEWPVTNGTALIRAAVYGHAEMVRLLVEHEGGMQDKYGVTALMWVVTRGHIECVKLLLEKEAGMQSNDGCTALMLAVLWNRVECVRLLAEREKDIKTTHGLCGYSPGKTALDIAKVRGYNEIISILSE